MIINKGKIYPISLDSSNVNSSLQSEENKNMKVIFSKNKEKDRLVLTQIDFEKLNVHS